MNGLPAGRSGPGPGGAPRRHFLEPLLNPRSIAVLGASERAGTVGCQLIINLQRGGYSGELYAVNPTRDSVFGLPCYPRLADLPGPAEHVIFALADSRVEAALDETIAHGARAATLYSTLLLENDTTPLLRARVAAKVRTAGLLLCGANGMGFYNFRDGVWACGFDTRGNHPRGGHVTLISHSGAGMSGILDCEDRIDFNLAVSTGQELSVRMDQYMDYAIECMDTRVIGLFMETARDPQGLRSVLAKAARRGIPVVALKVGRTERAARLAVSHCGAMAGRDAAYQALFDRYGVQRVDDMDELATALILCAQPHPVAAGGLVTLHDSGGERQLLVDLADRAGVPLTELSATTTRRLAGLLDPGLVPVNPLDAWSAGGERADQIMAECFAALMQDEHTALGAVVHDRAPHGSIYPGYVDYLEAGHAASGKPVFLVSNRQGTGADPLVQALTRRGFPVLDGVSAFLAGVRCVLRFRDFQQRLASQSSAEPGVGPSPQLTRATDTWSARLSAGGSLDEHAAGRLLADFGLPVNPSVRVDGEHALIAAAQDLGYPVVLKSAQAGLQHKTEQDGVALGLRNPAELLSAYRAMNQRLGPAALVCPMVSERGVEMLLGVVSDEQFGPLVLLGCGGIHAEVLRDVAWLLPPFTAEKARTAIDTLRSRPLLDGHRTGPAVDIDAFCTAAAQLSTLADALREVIDEIDINPVLVRQHGCIALDALVVAKSVLSPQ